MRLISDKNTRVESTGNVGVEHEFRMEASSKAFDIVIDKLYTNKIAAVIRELSTNAYEAHVMANKATEPFSVKLPNDLDHNFSVRDYGPGLSDDEIYNLYTVVFKSTKTNTNEVGGSFGIGSKVGFAYTKNFIVSSYQNGTKNVFAIYKNEKGIPACQKMASVSTTEKNGLEVTVPVQRNDIQTFKSNAQEIYRWFDTKPTITGQTISLEQPKVKFSGDGWKIVDNGGNFAIMGNVAYNINANYGYTGLHKEILSYNGGIQLMFDIGIVEPEPSRESLSFNKETIRVIESRLKLIKDTFEKQVQSEIDSCDKYWAAFNKLQEARRVTWFTGNLKWRGQNLVPLKLDFNLTYRYSSGKSIRDTTSYTYSNTHKFVIVDKLQTVGAIKQYSDYGNVYLAKTREEADTISDKLLIERSSWVIASSLPKPASRGRNSRIIQGTVLKLRYANSNQGSWEDEATLDLDTLSGLYVEVYRNKIRSGERLIDPQIYYKLMEELGDKTPVYGVKPASIEQFKKHKNWKCGLTAVKESYDKKLPDIIKYKCNKYIDKTLGQSTKYKVEQLNKFNKLSKLVDITIATPMSYEKTSKIESLIRLYRGYTEDYTNIEFIPPKETKELVERVNKFMIKYPLIANCSSLDQIPEDDLVTYIKSKK